MTTPYQPLSAYARLRSVDQRDGFCVLEVSGDGAAFDFASFAKHAGSWRPRIATETGAPAGYVTYCDVDAARQTVTLDVQCMDANALNKLAEGCLTGITTPLRTTGKSRGLPTVAPLGQPRLTDRPTDMRATFTLCDGTGSLRKCRFASAVRGGFRDPTIDVIKMIHAGTLTKSAAPEPVLDAATLAIKAIHRRR